MVLNTVVKENQEQVNTQTQSTEQVQAPPTSQSHHLENSQSEEFVDPNVQAAKQMQSVEALESLGKSTDTYR